MQDEVVLVEQNYCVARVDTTGMQAHMMDIVLGRYRSVQVGPPKPMGETLNFSEIGNKGFFVMEERVTVVVRTEPYPATTDWAHEHMLLELLRKASQDIHASFDVRRFP